MPHRTRALLGFAGFGLFWGAWGALGPALFGASAAAGCSAWPAVSSARTSARAQSLW